MVEGIADLLDRVAAEAGRRAVERLDPETAEKLDLLMAARARIAGDPDWRPPAPEVMEGLAGEVLAALEALPERLDWRTLPPSGQGGEGRPPRIEARRREQAPEPDGPRGAEGPLAWLLGLAVLTVMAMSLWL